MFPKNPRIEDRDLLDRMIRTPCLICRKLPSDPHHVTTVKAGGGDTPENVIPFCRGHHSEWHQGGPGKMLEKYPIVKRWLEKNERADILSKVRPNPTK